MSLGGICEPQEGRTGRDSREGIPSLRDSGEKVGGRKAWSLRALEAGGPGGWEVQQVGCNKSQQILQTQGV